MIKMLLKVLVVVVFQHNVRKISRASQLPKYINKTAFKLSMNFFLI